MTANAMMPAPTSRLHGAAFPHPADCRQCASEHRCPNCGNSKGWGPKAHLRHGPNRCFPAELLARETTDAPKARDRAESWLFERIMTTRDERPAGGVCGFRSLDELRQFTLDEAREALGRPLNVVHQLVLESAIRSLHHGLGILSRAIEAAAGGVQ